MDAPKLNEAMIRGLALSDPFSQGEKYFAADAVSKLTRRGNRLRAQVEGSRFAPYEVQVDLDAGGVVGASCTCDDEIGRYCEHVVAVLLVYVRQPERVIERNSLEERLMELRREELAEMVTKLLAAQPHLAEWMERYLSAETPARSSRESGTWRRRSKPIDPSPVRRQADLIFSRPGRRRFSDDSWGAGGLDDQVRDLLKQADPFIEAGDGRNALAILEAITEVYVERWTDFDDSDGLLGELSSDLGRFFAEAILSDDLSQGERKEWRKKLLRWKRSLEDYGVDEGFDIAIGAAVQGWEYGPLQNVLQGEISEKGAWEEAPPWFADDLTDIRLKILERQGRTSEYLNLAQAEGQTDDYVTMLVKLGRSQEAIEYGLTHLSTPAKMLTLARSLREHGLPVEALEIAEHGLTLDGDSPSLARWTRDLATGLGQSEVALKAAQTSFMHSLSLEDYQAAQAIAGAEWPTIKKDLLAELAFNNHASDKIDIFLYEGMIDKAVESVDERSPVDYYTLEKVVDAACQIHPYWVIDQCKNQAEPIMNRGQSKYYHHAVRWLGKARQAYRFTDREHEWRKYVEGLIVKHYRKSSLRPLLEALR